MKKIITFLLLILLATPIGAFAQVSNQSQVILPTYGGFIVATSTTGTSKLSATTTPFFNFFNFNKATGTQATTTNFYSTNFGLNSEYFTDLTGSGLLNTSGVLTCATASGSVFGCLSSTDWTTFNGKQAAGNYITALTGDVSASGPGSVSATLATVNGNVGSFGGTNSIPSFTVNGKGLITAASANTPSIPASEITSGTFGTGNYIFQNFLTVLGSTTLQNFTAINATTSQATTTNLSVGTLFRSGTSDGCATWAGGVLGSVGSACGSGGGSSGGTWSTTTSQVTGQYVNYPNNDTDVVSIGANSTTTSEFWFDPNKVQASFGTGTTGWNINGQSASYVTNTLSIGTTTVGLGQLTLGSSTAPQLTLSDNTAGDNHWVARNAGGLFALATSTQTATSTASAFTINASGFPTFASLGGVTGCAQFSSAGTLSNTGTACGSGSGGAYPFQGANNSTSTLTGFTGGLSAGASSTLNNFTFNNATGTSATTTNLSGTNISGFGLTSCTGTSALTYTGTGFTCTAQPQGTVTSVTGTYPVQSTGGATPVISLAFGTTTNNNWSGFNIFSASTTIGGGTTATGLTIFGGATTTGQSLHLSSTTLQNFTGINATTSQATTTSLAVTNLTAANCDVKALTTGIIYCGTDTTGASTYPFPNILGGGNATSSLTGFSGGILAISSSTIGDGTIRGGLTVNGGATTTATTTLGALYSNVTARSRLFSIEGNCTYPRFVPTGGDNSSYLNVTKCNTASDASILYSDQGNKQWEVGLAGDNNYYIKSITGTEAAGNEAFATRFSINQSSGVGTFAQQFNADKFGAGLTNGGTASYEGLANGALQGLRIQGTSATGDISFSTFVNGDGQLRFYFRPDGKMFFGNGTAVADASIERTGVAGFTITNGFTTTLSTTTSATTTNISSTNASTTNLVVSSAGGTAGCATFSITGLISNTGSACGGSGSAFPFTTGTFGATTDNATSTLLGFNNGFFSLASSTISGGLTVVTSTTTSATSTNLYVSGTFKATVATTTSVNANFCTTKANISNFAPGGAVFDSVSMTNNAFQVAPISMLVGTTSEATCFYTIPTNVDATPAMVLQSYFTSTSTSALKHALDIDTYVIDPSTGTWDPSPRAMLNMLPGSTTASKLLADPGTAWGAFSTTTSITNTVTAKQVLVVRFTNWGADADNTATADLKVPLNPVLNLTVDLLLPQ